MKIFQGKSKTMPMQILGGTIPGYAIFIFTLSKSIASKKGCVMVLCK